MLKQYFLDCSQTKVASLQDLLNTPLPKFLTGVSISSPSYAADFKGKQYARLVNVQQCRFLQLYVDISLSTFIINYSSSSVHGKEIPHLPFLICRNHVEAERSYKGFCLLACCRKKQCGKLSQMQRRHRSGFIYAFSCLYLIACKALVEISLSKTNRGSTRSVFVIGTFYHLYRQVTQSAGGSPSSSCELLEVSYHSGFETLLLLQLPASG